ncbi:fibronectin type III domain-containing protein [Hymenobacter sp. ASUV-10]|uniref:Fibronectin type III domain-containing protein n=1 Tax=Hymenobacter aranciens TaxID=3063996 RepID=A0ABT9BF39_9BACT|nr:fibronectin type III domain-containing protein [Hymenobacter sp. ASUV-10]MDO7876890.1 fibronectin type III domain-containing protein [Hymenobacter sp. ASUV-10]
MKQLLPKLLRRGWHLSWVLLLLLAHAGRAQVARYTFSQRTGTYAPLGAGSTLVALSSLPNSTGGKAFRLADGTIPFPFVFNARTYTGCYMHNSGYLTFGPVPPLQYQVGGTYPPWWYDPISEPTAYDGAVAPMATNLGGGASFTGPWAELRYQTLGTAPNRTFVLQWKDMYNADGAGMSNFQVWLHETTNVIDFVYGSCQSPNNSSAQVGLRGSSNTDFVNRTGFWNTTTAGTSRLAEVLLQSNSAPANGLVFTYSPPTPEPCPRPFSLQADSISNSSARLSWRVAGGQGPFTLRYGPAGFNPAVPTAGTTVSVPAGDTTFTVRGLLAFSEYDYYLTQNCGGAAGNSVISDPKGTFRTLLVNDDPVGAVAIPLSATCTPTAGTTLGATNTTPNGWAPQTGITSCNNVPLTNDVWYTFTTAATGPGSQTVRLLATGGGARKLMLFSAANGAAGPLTTLACVSSFSGGSLVPLNYGGLTPGTTYYVRVAGSTAAAPFTICATYPSGCGDPLNVAVGSLTATSASLSFTASTGSPGSYLVTLTPAGGPTTTIAPAPTASPVPLTNLIPGTTYTLTLQASCGAAGQSAVITRTFTTRVPNDEPAGAITLPLTATCQPTAGTSNGATASAAALTSVCVSNSTLPDVWYQFTTAATGPGSTAARLTLNGAGGFVVVVASSAGGAAGPFTFVSCSPNTRTSPHLDLAGLLASTTYYVRVRQEFSSTDPLFTICVSHPPLITCDQPVSLSVANLTTTTASLSWRVPGLSGTPASYEVSYYAPGVPLQVWTPAPTASPVTLTGLRPATNYTVRIRSNCGASGYSLPDSLRFRTAGPPPNDLCAGALPLPCGQSLTGTLTAATTTGEPATACAGGQLGGAGVWYVVQGTNQLVTVRSCHTLTGPQYMSIQLAAFTGSCGALSCLAVSAVDAACTGQAYEAVTFAAQQGQTYYVLVNSRSGFLPDFVLTTSCGPLTTAPPSLAAQVQLYPNPAHATATLELPAALRGPGTSCGLRNSLGQVVQQPALGTAARTELDLRGLAAGVYSLQVRTAAGTVTKRLVIE